MGKYEVTGQAVIYTADGAKIVDCEVRRAANVISAHFTKKNIGTSKH